MTTSIIEALVAIAHIAEEQWIGHFKIWFNKIWGYPETSDFPLDRKLNTLRNTWGLLIALAVLPFLGAGFEAAYLGFLAIDAFQHLFFSALPWSRHRAGISPGWITSFAYVGIVYWRWEIVSAHWIWAIVGALGLVTTYIEAWVKISYKKPNQPNQI